MKMSKKTIIIVIVVAVAAYLLWKRRQSKTVTDSTTVTGTATVETPASESGPESLDYILTHITFNSAERAKIEAVRKSCQNSQSYSQSVQAKANQNGRTFAQQLVCEALWLLYTENNHWTNARGWQLVDKVDKL